MFVEIRGSFNDCPSHGGHIPRFSIGSVNNHDFIKKCRDRFSVGTNGRKQNERKLYWEVTDKYGLNLLVKYFEQNPLQSTKKQKEYAIWKLMVDAFLDGGYKSPELLGLVKDLRKARKQSQ